MVFRSTKALFRYIIKSIHTVANLATVQNKLSLWNNTFGKLYFYVFREKKFSIFDANVVGVTKIHNWLIVGNVTRTKWKENKLARVKHWQRHKYKTDRRTNVRMKTAQSAHRTKRKNFVKLSIEGAKWKRVRRSEGRKRGERERGERERVSARERIKLRKREREE